MPSEKQEPLKVFISSTYIDLEDYRRTAIEIANRIGWVPLAMEFFVSQPQEPYEVAAEQIRDCDVFVGIYARRYRFVPQGATKSITQQEYELAQQLGKDCLCFLVDEHTPWPLDMIESDKQPQLTAFLSIIRSETVSFFTNQDDLGSKLASSLQLLERKRQQRMGVGRYPSPPDARVLDAIDVLLGYLLSVLRQLTGIDGDALRALPVEQRKEWSHVLYQLSRAASRLKTADRESVSDEFRVRVPELQALTAQLDNDLRQQRDAVTMIAAASAATKIIAEIVSLLV